MGLTGHDWVLENGSNVLEIADLVYAKQKLAPVRWVLAVPAESAVRKPEQLDGGIVATELVNVTRKFFEERNIDVDISFSWGATEAKAVSGLADAIVEVTETETTIRAHGLRVIHELMQSNTQLIASKEALADPWKKEKIDNIAILLQGALRADRIVGLKMNISHEKLDSFCQRYQVRRMSLFGSVLRDDYRADSDVDVLVQFDSDARISFLTLGKMQRELSEIFQRPVDLIPQDGLKPVIREEVLSKAQEVYAA